MLLLQSSIEFTQYNETDKQILNSAFGEYLPMSISLEIENILNA